VTGFVPFSVGFLQSSLKLNSPIYVSVKSLSVKSAPTKEVPESTALLKMEPCNQVVVVYASAMQGNALVPCTTAIQSSPAWQILPCFPFPPSLPPSLPTYLQVRPVEGDTIDDRVTEICAFEICSLEVPKTRAGEARGKEGGGGREGGREGGTLA
jgi:hypothetical protein